LKPEELTFVTPEDAELLASKNMAAYEARISIFCPPLPWLESLCISMGRMVDFTSPPQAFQLYSSLLVD
jgi:hypothetical protein